ncbi:MAG: N-acetylglucosaminyldiphosphoundecaprenol N-acetyl-beta-D-mannosaminyltransferase [Actinomycetota bacterium]|nr:N-acetylglucosaminyldiphosphoundecaprenol N-acetyl-beta-D-mannosaminyltransferase [Actinomycetota bacterium]
MNSALLSLPRRTVGPVPFRVVPLAEAVAAVVADALGVADGSGAPGIAVHFANAYTVALADADPGYAGLFSPGRVAVFTDGVPVAWAGRRFYQEMAAEWERVYGPDVMTGVLAASTHDGPAHYLLGGSPQVLADLQQAIARRWPEARIAGAESPPYRALTEAERADQDRRIAESGAQIVWVGLGTPKQDWEVARLAADLPVVAMAVGAAFDFLAGAKSQAPVWVQRSGLEWAYRLGTEPRRLGKRYLWGNPRFVLSAWRSRPRGGGG